MFVAEALECRRLFATVSWITHADGLWTTGSNWNTGSAPNPGDDVVINIPGLNIIVTYNGGATLPLNNTLVNNEILVIATGHSASWSSGTWSGAGRVQIDSGATLSISGSGDKTLRDGEELFNSGTVTLTGTGNIVGAVGAQITNEDTFNINSEADIVFPSGVGTGFFFNDGTVNKAASTGLTVIGGAQGFTYMNSGITNIGANSTIGLGDEQNTGSSSGDFILDTGATLHFMRGNYILPIVYNSGADDDTIPLILAPNATIQVSDLTGILPLAPGEHITPANVSMEGVYSVDTTLVDGGTFLFSQNSKGDPDSPPPGADGIDRAPNHNGVIPGVTNDLIFSSGTIGGPGAGVRVSSPYPAMEIGIPPGPPPLERPGLIIENSFDWTGGNMSGSGRMLLDENAVADVHGTGTRNISGGYIWDIFGTVNWFESTDFNLADGSIIWIHRVGLFWAKNSRSITAVGSTGSIFNMGNFLKLGDGRTTTIGEHVDFQNNKTIYPTVAPFQVEHDAVKPRIIDARIDIEQGTLQFIGNLSNFNVVLVKPSATLDFAGGIQTNGGQTFTGVPASILGDGTVTMNGAVFENNNGLYDIGTTTFNSGTYHFNNPADGSAVTHAGALNDGKLGGAGAFKTVGLFKWVGGEMDGTGGSFLVDSAGILQIENGGDRKITGTYTIDNRGRIRWNGPSGEINGGAYTQISTGTLELNLNGSDTFDSISTTGDVALNGALTLHANFTPTTSDSFLLISNGGSSPISGTFTGLPEGSTIVLNGVTFVITYTGGDGNDVFLNALTNPSITVDDVSVDEGNAGTTQMNFTVTLSQASLQTVTVDYATADGTAHAPSDYVSTSGTLSFAPGETSKTITVNVVGETALENDETLLLNLSNPTLATLDTTQVIGTIQDDDNPSTVRFASTSFSVNENAGPAIITVSRSRSDVALTVDYSTSNGTAVAPDDYTSVAGTISFPVGVTVRTFTVPVINDTMNEGNETVHLSLSNVVGGILGTSNANLTITNDDPVPTISIADASGDEAHGPLAFVVTLSAPAGQTVTVNYATADGSAVDGTDYTGATGTVTFLSGETSKTINIDTIDDSTPEDDEHFFVNLSNASHATFADAQGEGTLVHDAGTFEFASTSFTVSETDGTITFTVLRSGDTDGSVDVDFGTSNGTALAGTDYTAASGTLSFAPGQTSATFDVDVTDNRFFNATKTFNLTLSNPTNHSTVAVGTGSAVVNVTNDDPGAGIIAVATKSKHAVTVRAFTADTHTQTFAFTAYNTKVKADVRVATGDFNNDGVVDYATTLSKGGSEVRVFDGTTGTQILTFNAFDASVTQGVYIGAGDVNDDGFDDIIVSSGASPLVRVFDGQTGAKLAGAIGEFVPLSGSFSDGISVAAGDINGDGKEDVIVGAGKKSNEVRVFSGADQSQLMDFQAYASNFKSGVHVAAGDTDNDGLADVITGTRKGNKGLIRVFASSNAFALTNSFAPFGNGFTGSSAISAVNATGDGSQQVVAIRRKSNKQLLRVFNHPAVNDFTGFGVNTEATGTPFVAGS